MNADFFKFPSTPHLATLPGVDVRADKVLSEFERNEFLRLSLVIEEKVDGANLGISFNSEGDVRAQNRGAYLDLPRSGQWKKLDQWLSLRTDSLFDHLSDRFILFGEWCYARHTILYDRLPDWFLGFDLYDKRVGRFLSSACRDAFLGKMGVSQVPVIGRGVFTYPEIKRLLSQSKLASLPVEGVYLRADEGDWLAGRAKLVRSMFVQSMEQHWSRLDVEPNRLSLKVHG